LLDHPNRLDGTWQQLDSSVPERQPNGEGVVLGALFLHRQGIIEPLCELKFPILTVIEQKEKKCESKRVFHFHISAARKIIGVYFATHLYIIQTSKQGWTQNICRVR
jgi:hypothetical protein